MKLVQPKELMSPGTMIFIITVVTISDCRTSVFHEYQTLPPASGLTAMSYPSSAFSIVGELQLHALANQHYSLDTRSRLLFLGKFKQIIKSTIHTSIYLSVRPSVRPSARPSIAIDRSTLVLAARLFVRLIYLFIWLSLLICLPYF